MATVYSLICWGGKDGKAVTVSSSTDYVTLTDHGLHDATGVCFTSGTLPSVAGTALALNTTYYSKSISTSTYELYYDAALTSKIDFTSAGSSLVMKSAYYVALASTSRWGTRIYDSMASWLTGRSAASVNDTEVCEIGMAWDDITSNNGITIALPAGQTIITTMVDGVRSGGFHNGQLGDEAPADAVGYRLYRRSPQNSRTLNLNTARTTVDGFTVWHYSGMSGYTMNGIEISAGLVSVRNMIVAGRTTFSGTGISFTSTTTYSEVVNCVVYRGWSSGINVYQYRTGILVAHCLCQGNTTGFNSYASTNAVGLFYNNIAVGNTTNWSTTAGFTGAAYNAGESGDAPWDSVGSTAITLATTDFANYAGGNWTPAASSSPQVDVATEFFGSDTYTLDVAGHERPSYNNGGAEAADVGPYEFDNGYGNHPASCALSLTNVVSGSSIRIEQADGTLREFRTAASSPEVFTLSVLGGAADNLVIKVRKGSAAPKYEPYQTSTTITSGAQSIYIAQIEDVVAA